MAELGLQGEKLTAVREDVIRHLELVQAVIGRMAGTSFLVKGWTVTLSAALLALGTEKANPAFTILALFPAVSFWGLDAYYLRQERLFRKLYDDVRVASDEQLDGIGRFSMSTEKYAREVPEWAYTFWAPAIAWPHGVVVLTVMIVMLVLICGGGGHT